MKQQNKNKPMKWDTHNKDIVGLATYGTLRKLDAPLGYIYGYELRDTGRGYPAIYPTNNKSDRVTVSIVNVTKHHLFNVIDNYEKEGVLYNRTALDVTRASDQKTAAIWVYVAGTMLNKPHVNPQKLKRVLNGDWLAYTKQKTKKQK